MCPQRLGILSGELALIFCLPGKVDTREGVKVDAHFELCCQQLESVGHLLWECPFARNVWDLCLGKIQKCPNEATDFFFLFQMLVQRLSTPELEKRALYPRGFRMHVIRFILREIKPTPNPFWMGLLDSCMNTRTLWLHKRTLDKHLDLCSWCFGCYIYLEVQRVLLLVLLASALELALYLLDLQHVALNLFVSPLDDPKVFTYLYSIISIISLSFISKKIDIWVFKQSCNEIHVYDFMIPHMFMIL